MYKLRNSLGQAVMDYDERTRIAVGVRNAKKGEIFVRKQWFGGKHMKLPIAIDIAILEKLIKFGCKEIHIYIIGIEPRSFIISVTPDYILENGVKINYDEPYMKQGKNKTHFGSQIAFDCSEKKLDVQQKKL